MIVKKYVPQTALPEEKLTRELDRIWEELKNPDSLISRDAAEAGIPVEALRGLERKEVIGVRTEGAGLTGVDTVLVVVLLPLAMKAAEKITEKVVDMFWERVILRRLREREGEDALKEKSD